MRVRGGLYCTVGDVIHCEITHERFELMRDHSRLREELRSLYYEFITLLFINSKACGTQI